MRLFVNYTEKWIERFSIFTGHKKSFYPWKRAGKVPVRQKKWKVVITGSRQEYWNKSTLYTTNNTLTIMLPRILQLNRHVLWRVRKRNQTEWHKKSDVKAIWTLHATSSAEDSNRRNKSIWRKVSWFKVFLNTFTRQFFNIFTFKQQTHDEC